VNYYNKFTAKTGYKFNAEARMKMSLAKKGKPWSDARRAS
jgi:hypothetical protein